MDDLRTAGPGPALERLAWGVPLEVRASLPPAVLGYVEALEAMVAGLQAQVVELQARLGQNSTNSSRPPSSDPPWKRAKPPAAPGTRRAGGQPGHPGVHRALRPEGEVDEVVSVLPEHCTACGAALPAEAGPTDPADIRHQVTELPPLAVEVTEYRLVRLRRTAVPALRAGDASGAAARGRTRVLRAVRLRRTSGRGAAERAVPREPP